MVQQGNRQVLGQALLEVGKHGVAADAEIGLFHELLQVFHGGLGEAGEISAAGQELFQPAGEGVSPRFSMEEAPDLAGLGVVGLVQIAQQVVGSRRLGQCLAQVQDGWVAIRLLVQVMDDAVADWHRGKPQAGTALRGRMLQCDEGGFCMMAMRHCLASD